MSDDGYNRQNSNSSAGASSDGGYAKQVKKGQQKKNNTDQFMFKDDQLDLNASSVQSDVSILQDIKKQISREMDQVNSQRLKFSTKTNQYEQKLDQHMKQLAKQLKTLKGQQNFKNKNPGLASQNKDKKEEFERESKDIVDLIKDIKQLIGKHRQTMVTGHGQTELRLKQQEEDRMLKQLQQVNEKFQADISKFAKTFQTFDDLQNGRMSAQEIINRQEPSSANDWETGDYSDDEHGTKRRRGSRQVQEQVVLTRDQQLNQMKQKGFDAEMQQRIEAANDQKQQMQTFTNIMGDLNVLANDMGVQLQGDQKKIDDAEKNMEDAEKNMDEAQKQLLIKRESLIRKMKRVGACFVCLLVFFIILLISLRF